MAVSDMTFDLITALQNKLEAIQIYETYMEDCEDAGNAEARKLFEEISRDDDRHADRLRAQIERLVQDGQFK
jgi:rubrerythrin